MRINWGFMEDGLKYDVYTMAQKVKCPVLVVHGDSDTRVSVEDSRKLIKHLKVSDKLAIISGAGYAYAEGNSLQDVTARMIEFMGSTLKKQYSINSLPVACELIFNSVTGSFISGYERIT